jgi:hypothetical protein
MTTMIQILPVNCCKTLLTSSRLSTTGTRIGRLAPKLLDRVRSVNPPV